MWFGCMQVMRKRLRGVSDLMRIELNVLAQVRTISKPIPPSRPYQHGRHTFPTLEEIHESVLPLCVSP